MYKRKRVISAAIVIYWALSAILLSTIITVAQNNAPDTSVVLVMDKSESMFGTPLAQAKDAAIQFVNDIDGAVPISVVTFGSRAALASDFTTDVERLEAVIDDIATSGVTALYDATLLAVETAVDSEAENRIVILLSDGAEYGGQSAATRSAALDLAVEEGIQVYTVGLGFSIDRDYLSEIASQTDAEFIEVTNVNDLGTVYSNLSAEILRLDAETNSGLQPIEERNTTLDELDNTDITTIDPRNAIGIDDSEDEATADSDVETTSGTTVVATEESSAITPDTVQGAVVEPLDEILPIEVRFVGDETLTSASIIINDTRLDIFSQPPYRYPLDANVLQVGTYELKFEAVAEDGRTFADVVEFRVVDAADIVPSLDSDESAPVSSADSRRNAEGLVALIDGESYPFNFTFSIVDGLEVIVPNPTPLEVAETQNLTDILTRPFESIPLPVRETLTRQYPVTMAIVVLFMSIFLLPQGVFTIWWMTYTWVSAERYRKSSAPSQYAEPNYSFTALLPARKEEMVIYDTIMAVNGIRYPENLKETLVLIRDEDDDETIAETMRAIEDIKRTYERRGETYPNNVRLVTFTDGPKNKPNGLNRGYKQSTKNVLCIFDAEDQPHEGIYQAVNTRMVMDGADVVQSGVQLMNFKSTWFSSFNVLEYFFWFKSGLHAYTNELHVTPLGGNTVFFKKSWMDKLAAQDTEKGYRVWDEGKLTEDADVGIRLTKMGANIQIMYEAELATREETPAGIEEFIKQRTRWCQGFYEIFTDWGWLGLPKLTQRIASFYILMNSVLQALVLLFLPLGIYIGLTQEVPVLVALISWAPIYMLFLQMVITLIGMGEFSSLYNMKLPFLFRLRMMIFYYPYQLLLAVSAIRAIWRFFTNQSAWEKTSHSNLHRDAVSDTKAA